LAAPLAFAGLTLIWIKAIATASRHCACRYVTAFGGVTRVSAEYLFLLLNRFTKGISMNPTKSAFQPRNLSMAILLAAATFGTSSAAIAGQAPVDLGTAGTFAILSKTGVTDVYASAVTGNVGSSPITGAAILVTCTEVSGMIFSVDAAGPLPCTVNAAPFLTLAVLDMEVAYLDAAGRSSPDFTEVGAGEIGGQTLRPGLYKWGTGVKISNDVTLTGGPNDVFIFQIAGTLIQASATRVTLTGGAQAKEAILAAFTAADIQAEARRWLTGEPLQIRSLPEATK